MDKKLAQHMKMQTSWVMYKLDKEQASLALREVSRYEDANGFDIESWEDTDAYKEAYTEFTRTDEGFKALWDTWNRLFDRQMDDLREFCQAMVDFTDGQIDLDTAKRMATNPRYADRVEAILLGKDE